MSNPILVPPTTTRPSRDSIPMLARAVADHAIDTRPCVLDCPARQTEAWRASLAEDIACLARAQAVAADEKAAEAISIVKDLVAAWHDIDGDGVLLTTRLERLVKRAREIV